jgi:hypothetical protein
VVYTAKACRKNQFTDGGGNVAALCRCKIALKKRREKISKKLAALDAA